MTINMKKQGGGWRFTIDLLQCHERRAFLLCQPPSIFMSHQKMQKVRNNGESNKKETQDY